MVCSYALGPGIQHLEEIHYCFCFRFSSWFMFIIILGPNLRTYKAVSASGHTCTHDVIFTNCKWRNTCNILGMRKGQSCLPPVYFVCLCVFSDPTAFAIHESFILHGNSGVKVTVFTVCLFYWPKWIYVECIYFSFLFSFLRGVKIRCLKKLACLFIGLKIWMLYFSYGSFIYIKHIADLRSLMGVA